MAKKCLAGKGRGRRPKFVSVIELQKTDDTSLLGFSMSLLALTSDGDFYGMERDEDMEWYFLGNIVKEAISLR